MGTGDPIGRGGALLRALDRETFTLLSDATRHEAFDVIVSGDRPRTVDDIAYVAAATRPRLVLALRVLEHRRLIRRVVDDPCDAYVLEASMPRVLAQALVALQPCALRVLADPTERDVALAAAANDAATVPGIAAAIARPVQATVRTLTMLEAAGLVCRRRRAFQRIRYVPAPALRQLVDALGRADDARRTSRG